MKILLNRMYKKADYTIGKLYIDGKYFCDTIEDTCRGLRQDMSPADIAAHKIYGRTAIPTGEYEIRVTYSPRFKRKLPLLLDVPGFEGIRIHAGNTARDTYGCILPGYNQRVGQVCHSRATMARLQQRINNTMADGTKVTITIM